MGASLWRHRGSARGTAALALACAVVASSPAAPQDAALVPFPIANPLRLTTPVESPAAALPATGGVAPAAGSQALGFMPDTGGPIDLAPLLTPPSGSPVPVTLTALLASDGPPIPSGVSWWVYGTEADDQGAYPLIAEAEGGSARVELAPGSYYLYTAFGHAQVVSILDVTAADGDHQVILNAGGLRLHAFVGDDIPLPASDVTFDVYVDEESAPEGAPIIANAASDQILRLNAGVYHVVSRYGDTNAAVRADIEVEAGQLTDLSLVHQAARVTLKLVTERGSEALANTSWSVVSPGGESVFDSVGAFPTLVLAAGDYTAIAVHDDDIFQLDFTVEPGINRDVEVITDPADPQTAAN